MYCIYISSNNAFYLRAMSNRYRLLFIIIIEKINYILLPDFPTSDPPRITTRIESAFVIIFLDF